MGLPNGINVSLTWNTQDDLNLQVRAPNGGTLFWDSRSTNDSGVFGADANGLCEVLSTPPVTETASWRGGSLSAGRYEVLVYYRQACNDAPVPVDFTVNVTVNGTALAPVTGSLQPPVNDIATVYISSFAINPDGSATISNGGLYTDTRVLPIGATEILTAPSIPLFFNSPTEGVIVGDQYYQTYTFSGEAGQLVNISMTRVVGNLDTLLLLFDNTGNIIADNDDVNSPSDTNSAMSVRLPSAGTYTVFASRYGKDVGGTEGTYTILVADEAPERAVNLDLPTGDIEVTLTWNTNADLQLLVRDPFGDSVYDDTPSVRSGGLLTATGNRNCSPTLAPPPVYHIYWPQGTRDIGAYEVEIWYQSECGDTTPVNYNLYIVVGGELIFTETSQIRFNERYVTSFNINLDGTATPSLGGIIGGSETLPYQAELGTAIVMLGGNSFTGSITPSNKFDVYAFDGQVGDVVTITMTASSPTLDTLVFLIDPNQVEIARNDDANADTRNSAINRVTLAATGRYYILATHYGAIYGGTTGAYTLALQIERPLPPTPQP
ncbi:MAG: PPC domain-containing protein [Anaerolineae bacterium]|nr:PPC domain-containing protein [Anaerolineae bacterium]